ncbi:UNVERIFIED_CONTAM: hypothetical protein Sindi_0535600 [Sesamum indicum]
MSTLSRFEAEGLLEAVLWSKRRPTSPSYGYHVGHHELEATDAVLHDQLATSTTPSSLLSLRFGGGIMVLDRRLRLTILQQVLQRLM